MSEPAPSRTTATCECGRELVADDHEALVATFVEPVDEAHADWKVGETAVRNFLEALDRLTGPTERVEQIGAIEVYAATGSRIDDALRFFDQVSTGARPVGAMRRCAACIRPGATDPPTTIAGA